MSDRPGLRARFQHVPGMHRPRPLLAGAVFLALTALVLYSGYRKDIPLIGGGGTTVKAHFERAANANTGSTRVRVKGVDVGKVEEIERHPSGEGVVVTMRIEDGKGVELKRDARAAIYWRTLLGRNMYVELDPGSPRAEPLGDDAIPVRHTTTQVEFDDLLESYDGQARRSIRTFIHEFDRGFQSPDRPGRSLEELGPAMRDADPALRALRGTEPGRDLRALVRGTSRALGGLSHSEEELASLVDGADLTLGVTAARRADLGEMVRRAPAAMSDTRTTLTRLERTLDALDPVAAGLRPGARRLAPASVRGQQVMRELKRVLPRANPLLRDIRPALTSLERAADAGVPLMRRLDAPLERTRDRIIPFLDRRNSTTDLRNYQAIGPFFGALADSSKQFDRNGHMQRFQPGQGSRSLLSPLGCSGLNLSDEQLVSCQALDEAIAPIFSPRRGTKRAKRSKN